MFLPSTRRICTVCFRDQQSLKNRGCLSFVAIWTPQLNYDCFADSKLLCLRTFRHFTLLHTKLFSSELPEAVSNIGQEVDIGAAPARMLDRRALRAGQVLDIERLGIAVLFLGVCVNAPARRNDAREVSEHLVPADA